jgi:hypothetical protein
MEAQVAMAVVDARAIGYSDGIQQGKLQQARTEADIELRLRIESEARMAELVQGLLECLDERLASLRADLAEAVARILRAYLRARISREVTQELQGALGEAIATGDTSCIVVKGPKTLTESIVRMLPASSKRPHLELVDDEAVDVQVSIDKTSIETALAIWIEGIEAAR